MLGEKPRLEREREREEGIEQERERKLANIENARALVTEVLHASGN